MRRHALTLAAALAAALSACGGDGGATADPVSQSPSNSGQASAARPVQSPGANPTAADLGVVSSHGGPSTNAAATPAAPAASAGGAASDRDMLKTEELDRRITKAAEKAKAPNASAADKMAAAEAYLARGNAYFNAGNPRLYKYALADLRRVIRYDPGNEEARKKTAVIENIYRSMYGSVPPIPEEP